jgi:hypothetical protein
MWSVGRAGLGHDTQLWRDLEDAGRVLTFAEVCNAWRSDRSFRAFWSASLREIPFAAYCWECPPVGDLNRSRPFECVFVSSPSLARMPPEPDAFAEHYRAGQDVATFGNLGGDAWLVAPCPAGPDSPYAHLAQFVRSATQSQQDSLWEAVGHALESHIGPRPLWLSTAGHGVGWLHVRLDSRPKYYRHAEYKCA